MSATQFDCFAVAAPGLEPLVVAELAALGIAATPEPGGAAWTGTAAQLYAANLCLRTATRVTVTVGAFRARTFFELERHARRLPWERFLAPGGPVRLDTTCRKSRLYHEGAVTQRVLDAIAHRTGAAHPAVRGAGGEADEPLDDGAPDAQRFIVRFLHDRCIVRADASGALLHRRGYREAIAKAPLRETLAAAMLLGAGWRGDAPLLDPLCGAGTIVIEAALLARRIPPGLASAAQQPRSFAFASWPDFDGADWSAVVDAARARILPAAPAPILASDRDAGAIAAARANAERAGVLADVEFSVHALSAAEAPLPGGYLVTNPPYGVRVGEANALRNLYAALGRVARARCPGGGLALLSADRRLEAQLRLPLREVFRTANGGIPVRLMVGEIAP